MKARLLELGTTSKGKAFSIPVEAVTTSVGVLAKKRVGKTHNSSVLAEEMLAAGQQIVAIDPTDAWHGLRSSADGKSEGYSIVVLGGPHQDLPLEPTAGAVIADFVVDTDKSIILCLDGWSKGAQARFVTDFVERLFQRNKRPLHLFIDEADAFAPQKPRPEQMRMLGAIDELVRRGGIKGLGTTLITQRAQVISKDVISQTEVLILMRMIFDGDIQAVRAWTKNNLDPDLEKEIITSLASLAIGEAWVLSPGWLECVERVMFRRRRTFDSSATPKIGEIKPEPKVIAKVDLEQLRSAIADTVEQARANDPKELKARIKELEQQIAGSSTSSAPADHSACMEDLARATKAYNDLHAAARAVLADRDEILARIRPFADRTAWSTLPAGALSIPPRAPDPVERRPARDRDGVVPSQAEEVRGPARGGKKLPLPQRLLNALARLSALGTERVSKGSVSALAMASPTSSATERAWAELRTDGLIDYGSDATAFLTPAGKKRAAPVATPASASEILKAYKAHVLDAKQGEILDALVDAHPESLTKEDLERLTGASATSSATERKLAALRALDLVEYPERGKIRLRDRVAPGAR